MTKDYLTTDEVCATLRVTRQTLRTWHIDGKLPKYKAGRRVLYKVEDIKQFIESGRV